MSIKSKIKERYGEYKKSKSESKAFNKIVEQRALAERRRAYEKEALRQAKLQGSRMAAEKANRPSFGQRVAGFAQNITLEPSRPTARRTTVRRVRRRSAPKRKRRSVYTAPVRRRVKRRNVVSEVRDPLAATQNWRF